MINYCGYEKYDRQKYNYVRADNKGQLWRVKNNHTYLGEKKKNFMRG